MRENGRFPGTLYDTKNCVLEGFADRPKDCPNNPVKYPDNYRPEICRQCPKNPEIWKTAREYLPSRYIFWKQNREEQR